jgi:hypothetical protein
MTTPTSNNRPVRPKPTAKQTQPGQKKSSPPPAQAKTKTVSAPGKPNNSSSVKNAGAPQTQKAAGKDDKSKSVPAQQTPAANKPAAPPNSTAVFNSLLGQLGIKNNKPISEEQKKALSFAESMMAKDKLGGLDGRFNQDDVAAIASSVAKDSKGISPLVLSQAKTKQEYNVAKEYLTNGVNGPSPQKEILQIAKDRITGQVNEMVKSQMIKNLEDQGIGGSGTPDNTGRTVGVQDLAQFEESMRIIQGMQEGRGIPGMSITLPEGPSAKTFQDLANGVMKPEGVNVAFGAQSRRPAGTATTNPSDESAKPTQQAKPLADALKEAEGKMNDPKPSALPQEVQDALKVVIPLLGEKGLGGKDLIFNHADLPAIQKALHWTIGKTVVGNITDDLNANGVTGGKDGPNDDAVRSSQLNLKRMIQFRSAMDIIKTYGDEQAKINGFNIKPPENGIPQQMFRDLLDEKIPQFGTIQQNKN